MKKSFIAKLLVLGLVLTMLPTVAFAAIKPLPGSNEVYTSANGKPYAVVGDTRVDLFDRHGAYYYNSDDTTFSIGSTTASPAPAETTAPTDTTVPAVINEITEIKEDQVETTETATVVSVKADVKDGVASVALSEAAQEAVIAQLQEGKALTLKVEVEGDATKVAYTLPGSLLATVAEKTGADMTLDLTVATVTIPSAALAQLGDYEDVAVVADKTDGAYVIAVMADGKAINEKIEGLVVKF